MPGSTSIALETAILLPLANAYLVHVERRGEGALSTGLSRAFHASSVRWFRDGVVHVRGVEGFLVHRRGLVTAAVGEMPG
jgi:hypothetical protein